MKKRSLWGVLGMLALLLTFEFVLAGCMSTMDTIDQKNNVTGGEFQRVAVPDKDFTSLGLVFVEKSYDLDEKGARGDVYTYYALLQEAKKLGADYIVNVTIDVKTEGTFNTAFGKQTDFVKGKVTWYGAATAIKYTNSLKSSTTVVTPVGDSSVSTTTEGYYMNGESNQVSAGGGSGGIFGGGILGGGGNSGGGDNAKKGFFR